MSLSEIALPSKLRLRPNFKNKFNPLKVKEIIKPILKKTFKKVTSYQSEQVANITKDLANVIRDTLSDSTSFERYKFVVNVVIGEQRGEGVKMGCRCFWDEQTDNYACEVFMNKVLFCCVTVFGIYNY